MTYLVTLQPSGKQFQAQKDESILDAAARHGVVLPYGCRNGLCGACKGRVLSGAVSYEDGLPKGLSEDEAAQGEALFCKARASGDVVLEATVLDAMPDIQVQSNLACKVISMARPAEDVIIMKLKPAKPGFTWLAGQYIDFQLKDGRQRAFSLANAPDDSGLLELHLRHVPDGSFTDFVFNELKVKDILRIQGPLGTFHLDEDSDRPIILMGGGTGFAPLKAIMEQVIEHHVTRPVHLFWGVRALADLYMPNMPSAWAGEHGNLSYTPVLSEPDASDDWQGETGFVHDAVIRSYDDLSGYDVYMCGPPVMIKAGHGAFIDAGLKEEHLYYDSFDYAGD